MQQPVQPFSDAFINYFDNARLTRMYYKCSKYLKFAEDAEEVKAKIFGEDEYDYFDYDVDDGRSPFYRCIIRDVLRKELVEYDRTDIENYYHHGFTISRFVKKYNKGIHKARRYIYDMLVNLSEINFPTASLLEVSTSEINFSWWLAEMVSTTNRHETNLINFGFFGGDWDSDIILNLDKYILDALGNTDYIYLSEGDSFAFIGFVEGMIYTTMCVVSNVECHFDENCVEDIGQMRFLHVYATKQDIEKSEYGSLNMLVEGLAKATVSESRVIGFGDAEVKVAYDESRLSWTFTLE